MATATFSATHVELARKREKRRFDHRDTDAGNAKKRRLAPATSPSSHSAHDQCSPRSLGSEATGLVVSNTTCDTIEGLLIYSLKGDEAVDLIHNTFSERQQYCVQSNITCDYFKHRPAIRHFLFHLIDSKRPLGRHFDHERAAERIEIRHALNRIKAAVSCMTHTDQCSSERSYISILIKLRSEIHPLPIQCIISAKNRERLDEYLGEDPHMLLRAIALHQAPPQSASNTEMESELGLAIGEIETALSPYIIFRAQWELPPDELFDFVRIFHRLGYHHCRLFFANWFLWQNNPRKALKTLGDENSTSRKKGVFLEIRARYALGDLAKARELRVESSSLGPLQSATYDLFELSIQEGDHKKQSMRSLRRIFSELKVPGRKTSKFFFYATKGCFLYHEAVEAGEDEQPGLMLQAIKAWVEALDATKTEEASHHSMNLFIAELTLCALKFKCKWNDAEDRFAELSRGEHPEIINYYLYISKEWLDVMYRILEENGKRDYVKARFKRVAR
ncbi:hypothetical protein FSARC_1868 [Fusarium sarcochroum]|uniref:Uncharacterized protein n=1 Tax=Fusarium sarcochroum TaxID=1208366 RepID=A0A8H4U7K0_9HYPO|nr:hypothetical protein FSARC_1868 [Fusarium sarcochroum]